MSILARLSLSLLAAVCIPIQAQTPITQTYDIISIHQNKSGTEAFGVSSGKASFNATNITFGNLLYQAYHIGEDQTSGLLGPVSSARFDIVAKVSDASPEIKLTSAQRQTMMVALLTERFKLKAHTEMKMLPIFELVVLPGGPKFKPTAEGSPSGWSYGARSLIGHATPLSTFVDILAGKVDRTIADKTGLTGKYDLTLKWNSDETPDPQSQDPPLLTALQEQLGLKLRSAKGPVETLVVEHVEMPTEN